MDDGSLFFSLHPKLAALEEAGRLSSKTVQTHNASNGLTSPHHATTFKGS